MSSMKSAFWKIGLLFILLAVARPGWSQTRTLTGKITSGEDNQPLAGVTVTVKGKGASTQTATNGEFTTHAVAGDVLVFSYTGFITQEVRVTNSSTIDISLKPREQKMDE